MTARIRRSLNGTVPNGSARAVVGLALAPTAADTLRAAVHWSRVHDAQGHDVGARLDPVRHLALRLGADAAYGTGVILAAARSRTWSVLRPRLRARPGRRRPGPAAAAG